MKKLILILAVTMIGVIANAEVKIPGEFLPVSCGGNVNKVDVANIQLYRAADIASICYGYLAQETTEVDQDMTYAIQISYTNNVTDLFVIESTNEISENEVQFTTHRQRDPLEPATRCGISYIQDTRCMEPNYTFNARVENTSYGVIIKEISGSARYGVTDFLVVLAAVYTTM